MNGHFVQNQCLLDEGCAPFHVYLKLAVGEL